MNENLHKSVTKIAVISVTLNIVTIFLAQLSIAFKHIIFSPDCHNKLLPTTEQDVGCLKSTKCAQIFEFDIYIAFEFDIIYNSMDIIFVSLTLFSIIPDLPASVMLVFGVKCKVSWLFLPWLVVTKIKIIGCIVISCLWMYFIMDVSMSYQNEFNNTHCSLVHSSKPR